MVDAGARGRENGGSGAAGGSERSVVGSGRFRPATVGGFGARTAGEGGGEGEEGSGCRSEVVGTLQDTCIGGIEVCARRAPCLRIQLLIRVVYLVVAHRPPHRPPGLPRRPQRCACVSGVNTCQAAKPLET